MLRLKVRKQALREVGKAFAVGFMAAAVLWLTSGFPVASQQPSQPPTREQILQGLERSLTDLATFIASEGDILDLENAVYLSFPMYADEQGSTRSYITAARIPLHPSSDSTKRMLDWLAKGMDFGESLNLGALYVANDWPGCSGYDPLKAGVYQLKALPDSKIIAVDAEGATYTVGYIQRLTEIQTSARTTSLAAACPLCIAVGGAVLIALCAASAISGADFCITEKVCVPQPKPDGGYVMVCWEEKTCYGCSS